MRNLDPKIDAKNIQALIRKDNLIPYDTGNLSRNVKATTRTTKSGIEEVRITLSGAKSKVPYAVYLEEGTSPHDIPNAFGRGERFGIGGRFDGKFHPGSTKHKNFIEYVLVYNCLNYYKLNYDVVKMTPNNAIGELIGMRRRK